MLHKARLSVPPVQPYRLLPKQSLRRPPCPLGRAWAGPGQPVGQAVSSTGVVPNILLTTLGDAQAGGALQSPAVPPPLQKQPAAVETAALEQILAQPHGAEESREVLATAQTVSTTAAPELQPHSTSSADSGGDGSHGQQLQAEAEPSHSSIASSSTSANTMNSTIHSSGGSRRQQRPGEAGSPYSRSRSNISSSSSTTGGGSNIDPRLARLARELVLARGGAPLQAVLLSSEELSEGDARQLLAHLGRLEAPDVALEVFRWLRDERHPAWAHDPVVYTKLMQMFARRSLGQAGAALALEVYDEMEMEGVVPDLVAYNCALAAAGRAQKWGRLTAVLSSMEDAGVQRDAFTYTSLLKACQLSGRWQQALEWFEELEQEAAQHAQQRRRRLLQFGQQQPVQPPQQGVGQGLGQPRLEPNVVHYTTLMSTLQRAGRWEQALEVFGSMEGAGVDPDVQAYNAAITACATGHNWEKAWALFAAMKRAGLRPSTVSYNALISACERCGQVDRALEMYSNMRRTGVAPNAVTFNTLISAAGKAGRYETALRLHGEMNNEGVPDDVFTLASLVTACEKAGGRYWRDALQHFEDFRKRGIPPNTVAYNALISALGSAGRWEAALEAFDAMRADPHPSVAPDVVTYGSLIAALERGGQWQRALAVYDQMRAEGRRANGYIITSLLNACEKGMQWEKAGELFRLTQELDVGTDTMTIMARKALYAFPWLIGTLPAPLVKAARAAVESGRAARRWISKQ